MAYDTLIILILDVLGIIVLFLIAKYDNRPNHNPTWYEINNHYIRDKGE